MKTKILEHIFKFSLFFLFVNSMYPWFFWTWNPVYINIICLIISIIYFLSNTGNFTFSSSNKVLNIALFLVFIWMSIHSISNVILANIILFSCVFFVINLKQKKKIEFIEYATNGMAIILFVSLIFYIMFLMGVPLPNTSIHYIDGRYEYNNYYAFIIDADNLNFFRFRSIFLEPGHLTMGLIPLLFVNRFNISRVSVLILFIAELLTFSLAGYITLAFGLIYIAFSRKQGNFQRKLVAVICALIILFSSTINEDSILYKAIIYRLENNEGSIVENERFSESLRNYYSHFITTPDVFSGIGTDKFNSLQFGANSGYKVFIVKFGIIGCLFVIVFYFLLSFKYRKYEICGMSIICIMLLVQNAYPFWPAFIFTYICGVPYIAFNTIKNR